MKRLDMVGVEIVGVILASLPLAISAIEHYREAIDPMKDWFHYDRTLKSLRIRLRIQQDLFEGTLKRLLLPLLSPTQAQDLFPESDQSGARVLWGTSDIEEKLRTRLGSKYENFMDVVGEMESMMRELGKGLDLKVGATRIGVAKTIGSFLA